MFNANIGNLRARGALIAFAAVFAMGAVTAASASAALPEFKPVPVKKKFKSTGGISVWRTPTNYIECQKTTISGEITGANTLGKAVVKFTGCEEYTGGGAKCGYPKSTNTTTQGEIITNALIGELGTVATVEAASGVGLLFEPETGHVLFTMAEDQCAGSTETAFEGSIAGEVPTIGKKQLTNKLVFGPSAEKGTKQKIKEITTKHGVVRPKIISSGATEMAIEASNELTFEEALEVT